MSIDCVCVRSLLIPTSLPGAPDKELLACAIRTDTVGAPLDFHTTKQRPCRCLRSITDESSILIELMILLGKGYRGTFTAPRRSPLGLVAMGPPRERRTGLTGQLVRLSQLTCKSASKWRSVGRAVLPFLLSGSTHSAPVGSFSSMLLASRARFSRASMVDPSECERG